MTARPKSRVKRKTRSSLVKKKLPQEKHQVRKVNRLTQAKKSTLKLIRKYDSYSKIQDSLSCIAILVDNQARILSWNRVAEKVLGYKRKEVLGNNKIWEWLYPEPAYREEIFKKGEELIRSQELANYESTVVTRDGSKKVISWHGNQLKDESGRVRAVLALGSDVTEQKRIEEQVRLKEKMDGLARLAGRIAHDFNNTLSIIRGYVDLILEQVDLDASFREDLLEIADAIERGSAYTNQLLTFSRNQFLEPIILDLNKSIREMTQAIKRTLADKIELILILSKNLPTIKADPRQIQQVILNLALNAREAMPEGGKFTIATSIAKIEYSPAGSSPLAFMSPGDYVVLSVSDTGPGLEPELKERLFEPFITTKWRKTGFGLAEVYGIVTQHNGHIQVESGPGKGTIFQIYLPVSGKPVEVKKPKPVGIELPRGKESILLVEDDDNMRSLAVRILRNLGYRVIETNNPGEALQILEQYPEPIDLLLTDVEMPVMTGAQLAEKALKLKPYLKVLYFSGYSMDYLLDKKILQPCSSLVAKPFSIRSLSQKVREILNKK